jgi:hypothetical protein
LDVLEHHDKANATAWSAAGASAPTIKMMSSGCSPGFDSLLGLSAACFSLGGEVKVYNRDQWYMSAIQQAQSAKLAAAAS